MALELFIANKNYSSWSLRAWLTLREAGLSFQEHLIPLGQENTVFQIRSRSPSGRLPLLVHDDTHVWDSLAISEYIAEVLAPTRELWPKDTAARAEARSLCAEMHAGFMSMREELPMNIRKKEQVDVSDATKNDIARIFQIWGDCRKHYGNLGPFLFGKFSIADSFFAPVHMRFVSYGIPYPNAEMTAYRDHILGLKGMREWIAASEKEEFRITKYE